MSFVELLEHEDTVSSTMAVARLRAMDGAPEGTTVSARTQTAGRGRRGRSWFSPQGGLYMTTLLRPTGADPEALPQLALVAGLAVRAACARAGAEGARIKWPNDVVVGRKKLAGVLVETLDSGVVLVGVGLNLSERGDVELPEELTLRFIGLGDLVRDDPNPRAVAGAILEALEGRYRTWRERGLSPSLEELEAHHALTGQVVRAQVGDHTLTGICDGIDPDGALRIHTQNGVERVRSGEVTYVRPGS